MKILAAGGCINKQQGLSLRKHYHFLLRDMYHHRTGAYPEMQLETYYNYFDLSQRIKESLASNPNVLIFFIRPFPLHPLLKPLVKYKRNKEKVQTILHPAFRKANASLQRETMTDHIPAQESGSKNRLHRVLAHVNISAGRVLGLEKWALNHVSGEILKINEYCRQGGTKLILAGPPRYPAYAPLDNFCRKLNIHIADLASAHRIAHADISATHDEKLQHIFESDGFHMAEAGHALMADSIFKFIP